jgi:hypothetical protein
MRHNFTRQTPPTAEEIQAREQWLSEQRAESDRVNAELMLAGRGWVSKLASRCHWS